MARTTTGSSTHGDLYELDAIAAVIIGGTLLTGGRGTIIGSILGLLIFTVITNLFILNGLNTSDQLIAKGADHRRRRAAPAAQPRTRAEPARATTRRPYHPTPPEETPMSQADPGTPRIPARRSRRRRRPLARPAPATSRATRRPPPPPPLAATGNEEPGTKVVIGFSAPAADHGWIAAIAKNAEAAAKQYSDVEFKAVEPTNDINQQISAVESLIDGEGRARW